MWNFNQKSVLKLENFKHSLVDKSLVERGLQKNQEYKLKDEIQVSVDVYEKVNGLWVPFKVNDIELQFIMLDPYVRVILENKVDSQYTTKFNVPDHNGVYKFMIDYNKHGYTHLHFEEIAPVRVLNHDEFPRFVPSAYPYHGAVLLVILGFLAFSIKFVTLSDGKEKEKVKKD